MQQYDLKRLKAEDVPGIAIGCLHFRDMGHPIAAGPIDAFYPTAQPFVGQGLRCVLG
jgi:hypothetical protein